MPDFHLCLELDTNPAGADRSRCGHGVQLHKRVRSPSDRRDHKELPRRSALTGDRHEQPVGMLPEVQRGNGRRRQTVDHRRSNSALHIRQVHLQHRVHAIRHLEPSQNVFKRKPDTHACKHSDSLQTRLHGFSCSYRGRPHSDS